MKIKLSFLFILLFISPFTYAQADNVAYEDCSYIQNECDLNITKLNEDLSKLNITKINLTNESQYYQNLSIYYKELYENASAGITNKNLNNIYMTQYNLNQSYTELTQNYEKITNWNIGLTLGFFGIAIFEIVNRIKMFRKRKKQNEKE